MFLAACQLHVHALQLFFELSVDGARTHGSILEFTAAEGTVGVTPEVCSRLLSHSGVPKLRSYASKKLALAILMAGDRSTGDRLRFVKSK